jgi:hypothetical protein
MKEPVELLLRALLAGLEVSHDGRRWAMAEDGSLGVVCYNETTGEEELLRVDCDIRAFKAMADQIGRDKLWLLCCGLAMSQRRATMN